MLTNVKKIDLTVGPHPAVLYTASGAQSRFKDSQSKAHSDFILQHPDNGTASSASILQIDRILKSDHDPKSCLEVFGGCGWRTAKIHDTFDLDQHLVWDYDTLCVVSAKATTPAITGQVRDSYNTPLPEVDWVDVDHNDWTLNKAMKRPPEKVLFTRVFKAAREWVTLTDSTLYGIRRFSKNLRCYEGHFGCDLAVWQDYYDELDAFTWDAFGFALERVTLMKGHRCALLTFRRGGERNGARGIVTCTDSAPVKVLKETEMKFNPASVNVNDVQVPA